MEAGGKCKVSALLIILTGLHFRSNENATLSGAIFCDFKGGSLFCTLHFYDMNFPNKKMNFAGLNYSTRKDFSKESYNVFLFRNVLEYTQSGL